MSKARYFKWFYFVFFAAGSGFIVFRNAYFESIGMTGLQMGIVGFLLKAAGILAQPAWGLLGDRLGAQRRLLMAGVGVSGAVMLVYPRVARVFPVLVVATVVFAAFRTPVRPMANAMLLSEGFSYGSVRAYGSIAYGIAALGLGVVIARLGSAIVFYTYAAGMALLVAILTRIPVESKPPTESVGLRAVSLVRDRNFAALLAAAFVMGAMFPAASTYLAVYVRAIGASDAITGLSIAVKTLAEGVVFLYATRLAISYRALLAAGAGCHVLAYVVYATTAAPILVVSLQFVVGVGYAAFMLAAVNLAYDLAAPSIKSTAQTFLAGFGLAAGTGVGTLATGWLLDLVGVQAMYGYVAFLGVAVLAASALLDGSIEADGLVPESG